MRKTKTYYALAFTDIDIDERPAFWTTRCGDTDNYTFEPGDATLFASKSAACALMRALKLEPEHVITELRPS
jgi:hypothetical protein